MTTGDGHGAHDQPELTEDDAWWLRERAARARAAEAPPEQEGETPPPVGPASAPPAEAASRAEPSRVDPGNVAVVAAATTRTRDTGGRPRTSGRRRNAVIAGVLALALVGLVAVLLAQTGDDDSDVATTDAAVTTAAPTTTGSPAGGSTESVTVNTDVLFDVGSSQLTTAASSRLGNVLSLAQTDPNRHLLIEGFTDSDGEPSLNQQLSEARAQAVAQWLIEQGIAPARISAVGHGEDNPVAPNDTPENKALNRRVVVALQT